MCWKLPAGIKSKVILIDMFGKVSELKYLNAIYLIAKTERRRENFARYKIVSYSTGIFIII
jgi:hypothetical protein